MKAEKDKVVAVSYVLEVEGGIADSASSDKPLEYIHGTGMLIPKFEQNIEGKEPGETFDFVLSPEEGYGPVHPGYIIDIPIEAFAIDGEIRRDLLQPGRIIPMLNNEGQVVQGKVAEVGESSVKMDFNHPMAGKTLHFTGTVVSVREATEKELTEGLHGEYLPQEGCGGHCHGGCHGEGGCHKGEGEGCCHEGEGEGHCHKGEGEGCCHGGEGKGHCRNK